MSWSVYIVQCRDGSLYTGIAKDVQERIRKHNHGTGAKYTATRRPVTLVWQEAHADASAALKREIEIKSWRREDKQKLITGESHGN